MSSVYFLPVSAETDLPSAARRLLEVFLEKENLSLPPRLPLKLHFGEKGNRTYLKQEIYAGILDLLQEKGIQSEYMETSVLYGGERFTREKHLRLAAAHGFDRLPVVIADGEKGEDAVSVPVRLKHFSSCAIARKLAEADQVLVLSHFKGHALAGFGGAIKQLSMGFAAKGGKMAMHLNVQPTIRKWFCRHCGLCVARCQSKAITLSGGRAVIDRARCIGCGACFSICPHHAVSILSWKGFCNALFHRNNFREKLAEYAYASSHGKPHIYLNFALNITGSCDCDPRPMRKAVPDIGIFASLDPVAIDHACYQAVARAGKCFKGAEIFEYAEKIGLGTTRYQLIPVRES